MSDSCFIPYDPSDLLVSEKGELCKATLSSVAVKSTRERNLPMYRIMYRAERANGSTVNACDFITMPACMGKLGDLARCLGPKARAQFESKTFTPAAWIGAPVTVFLQPSATGMMGTFNKVVRYWTEQTGAKKQTQPEMNEDTVVFDESVADDLGDEFDDLPF